MVRRDREQDTHKAKIFSPMDTSSLRTGTQSTVGTKQQVLKMRSVQKDRYSMCTVFTQCVDDAHGQLNAQEHEGPACSSESPCLHAVILMFFSKNLL